MAILNYTTSISAHKTVGEIQQLLAQKGARGVSIDYDAAGQPAAVAFWLELAGNPVSFRLPSNWTGVRRALDKDRKVPARSKTDEQAQRVAWRIVKDWTEAQLAIVEAGIAGMAEVFLPYAVTPDGRTLFQAFEADGPRLLAAPRD